MSVYGRLEAEAGGGWLTRAIFSLAASRRQTGIILTWHSDHFQGTPHPSSHLSTCHARASKEMSRNWTRCDSSHRNPWKRDAHSKTGGEGIQQANESCIPVEISGSQKRMCPQASPSPARGLGVHVRLNLERFVWFCCHLSFPRLKRLSILDHARLL